MRDEVIVLNVPLAESIAARYRNRGVDADDLGAVARLGLVKAADRFDASAGYEFHSFAGPTIRGEIKRHFRDLGWMVRPPRRLQELQTAIAGVDGRLTASLGTPPTTTQIAAALDSDARQVEEALAATGCFRPASLDQPLGNGSAAVSDLLGGADPGQDAAEARVALAPVLRRLDDRDRRAIRLRFFDGLTQQEIADDLGVTQMQVSRMLSRILKQLRGLLTIDDDAAHARTKSDLTTRPDSLGFTA